MNKNYKIKQEYINTDLLCKTTKCTIYDNEESLLMVTHPGEFRCYSGITVKNHACHKAYFLLGTLNLRLFETDFQNFMVASSVFEEV